MDERVLRRRLAELEQRLGGVDATEHELRRELEQIHAQLDSGTSGMPPTVSPPRDTRTATSRRARAPVLAILLVLALAVGLGGFFLSRTLIAAKRSGHVSVVGSVFGTFAFEVKSCDSGTSYVPPFFGADVKGDRGQLRIYNTGDDAYLALWRPGTKQTMNVARGSCTRWDVLVEWAHVKINNVSAVNGHLHVDCALPGGGSLAADAEFARCAF